MTFDPKSAKRIRFLPNWKLQQPVNRDFLIRSLGDGIPQLVDGVATAIGEAETENAVLGVAAETRNDLNREVTLRFVQSEGGVHQGKVDVSFVRRAQDLFVRVSAEARTWLRYLSRAVAVGLFAVLFPLLTWGYLNATNAFGSIVDEVARNRSGGGPAAGLAVKHNIRVDPESQEWVPGEKTTFLEIFRRSPRTVFFHLATPCLLIAGVAGGIAWVVSSTINDRLCLLIGWPTRKQFDDFVTANESWILGVVNRVLAEQFHVTEADKIAC